jgi:hypothetical protein
MIGCLAVILLAACDSQPSASGSLNGPPSAVGNHSLNASSRSQLADDISSVPIAGARQSLAGANLDESVDIPPPDDDCDDDVLVFHALANRTGHLHYLPASCRLTVLPFRLPAIQRRFPQRC